MNREIDDTRHAPGPKGGGPGVFISLARKAAAFLTTVALGVAIGGAAAWACGYFYQYLSQSWPLVPAALTESDDTDPSAITADPKAAVLLQIEAWDRQRQNAIECAHAARIAYAMLRNGGSPQNSAECDAQVRRTEAAEREAEQCGRQIELAGRALGVRDVPIVPGLTHVSSHAAGAASEPNSQIPDRTWRGGNDRFMAYQPTARDAQ